MIKISLVDDHTMFRDGLKFALSQIDKFEIIGDYSNGKEFLADFQINLPDIVLMDIAMPEMDGIETSLAVLTSHPNLRIIAISMFGDTEYYQKMVSAGVKGFLLKEAGINELEKAILDVHNGGTYFSQDLLQKIIMYMANKKVIGSRQKVLELTRREEEVLELICKGYDNKEVADLLFVSQKTVEGHKTNLLSKTNTKNSINLMLFAIKNNLVDSSQITGDIK